MIAALIGLGLWGPNAPSEKQLESQQILKAQQRLDGLWPIQQTSIDGKRFERTLQIAFRESEIYLLDQGRVTFQGRYGLLAESLKEDLDTYIAQIKCRGRHEPSNFLRADIKRQDNRLAITVCTTREANGSPKPTSTPKPTLTPVETSTADETSAKRDKRSICLDLITEDVIAWPIQLESLHKMLGNRENEIIPLDESAAEKMLIELRLLAENSGFVIR